MNKVLFSSGYEKNNRLLNKLGYKSKYSDYYKQENTIWCFGDSLLTKDSLSYCDYLDSVTNYKVLNFGVKAASIYTIKRILEQALRHLETPKYIFITEIFPYRKEYLLDDGYYYQASLGIEKQYPILPFEGSGFPYPLLYDLSEETKVNYSILDIKNIPYIIQKISYSDLRQFYVFNDKSIHKKIAKEFYNTL